MCLTGNSDVSKDVLPRQINFIYLDDKMNGTTFLKRVLKRVDIVSSIKDIEERFLPDGDKQFLLIVLESLTKGKKI